MAPDPYPKIVDVGRATVRCYRLVDIGGVMTSVKYRYVCVPDTNELYGNSAWGLPYYRDENFGTVTSGCYDVTKGYSWYQGCASLENFILCEDDTSYILQETTATSGNKILREISSA